MEGWVRTRMTAEEAARGGWARLQDAFEEAFTRAGAPQGAAMFMCHAANRDCEFYFTAAAVRVFTPWLRDIAFERCAPPPREGSALLVGHQDALELLR